MFPAQYLFKGASVFSPWMPRGGDNLRVTAQLVDNTQPGGGNKTKLEVRVFEKNSEDTDNGEDADISTVISLDDPTTAGGIGVDEWNGLEELVRYKFTCVGDGEADYVLFRMLPPVWFDAVDGSL